MTDTWTSTITTDAWSSTVVQEVWQSNDYPGTSFVTNYVVNDAKPASSDGTVRYRVPLAFSADTDPASLPGVYAAFVSAGDYIAIFDQATSSRNGLYTVNSDKTALVDKHTWDLDDVLACTQVEVYGGVMTSFGFVRGEQNLQVIVPQSGPPALAWPDVSYQSPTGVAIAAIHDDIAALQPITNLASFQQASPQFAPTKALRLTGGDGWSITPQPPLPTTSAELMLLTRLDPHNETEDRFYELIAIEAEMQTPTSSWDTYEPAILVNEDGTIDLFTDGTVPGGTAEIQGHVVPDPPITYGEWIRLLQRTTLAGADTTIEWWREVTVDWDLEYEGRRWRRLSDDIEHPELTALLNQRYRTVVGKQFVGDLAEWDYRVDGTPVAGWTEADLTVSATSFTDAYGNTIQRNGSGSIVGLEASGGSGPDLSDDDPEALGTADPGTSTEASRSDHVHPPTTLNGAINGPPDSNEINDSAFHTWLVAKLAEGANIDLSVNGDNDVVIAATGLTPTSRTIASLDLSTDRTAAELFAKLSPYIGRQLVTGTAGYGQILIPGTTGVGATTVAKGNLYLATSDVWGQTTTTIGIFPETAGTSGDVAYIVCYLLGTDGLPTTLQWSQSVATSNSTSFQEVTAAKDLPAAPYAIGVFVPASNTSSSFNVRGVGSTTRPTMQRMAGTGNCAIYASPGGNTPPSDVSAYTVGSSPSTTVWGQQANTPEVWAR